MECIASLLWKWALNPQYLTAGIYMQVKTNQVCLTKYTHIFSAGAVEYTDCTSAEG